MKFSIQQSTSGPITRPNPFQHLASPLRMQWLLARMNLTVMKHLVLATLIGVGSREFEELLS